MRIKKLLFIIPVLVLMATFVIIVATFSPITAVADVTTTPSLDLVSFEREYGDFVLGTQWTYSASDDVFISYGNVSDGKYIPQSNGSAEDCQYECRLHLLVEDENGDISPSVGSVKLSKPYDSEGNCTLSPFPTNDIGGRSYRLYQGFFKNGSVDTPFATLRVTEKGAEEGLSNFTLSAYSTNASIIVKKKKITVGVNLDELTEGADFTLREETEASTLVKNLDLNRTFSLETHLNLVDEKSSLVFNHKFGDFIATTPQNNGLYIYDNVGSYDAFTLDNSNVVILDDEGNDVTNYYEISSNYNINVTVNRLRILAPIYNFRRVYLQDCIDLNDIEDDSIENNVIIQKSDYNLINRIGASISDLFKNTENKIHYLTTSGNIATNENLSVDFNYLIKTSRDYFYNTNSDNTKISLYVNGSTQNTNPYYQCLPVLVNVSGYEVVGDFNNNDNFELICEDQDLSTFTILKRTVMFYAEDVELPPELTEGKFCVPVKNFSNPYGLAYAEKSAETFETDTVGDGINDLQLTVSFKIKDFDKYFADPNFYTIGDLIILNAGKYDVEPEELEDWRYNATFHESVYYEVTARQISLSELLESENFVGSVDFADDKYIISSFNFETDPADYETVALQFTQKLPYYAEGTTGEYIENNPTFSFKFNFNAENTPGVFLSTGLLAENYNYELTDLVVDEESGAVQNIAIRIYNKILSASIANIEYDGTTPEVVIEGKEDGFDYNVTYSYYTGNKADSKNKLTKAPTDAGKYTVRVKLDEGSIYAFAGGKDYIDLIFEITKRKIVVTVTAKGNKMFGTEGYFKSPTNSNIATYTVAYNGEDTSKPALIGKDTLGNLSSDASSASAKPQTYDILTKNVSNPNYDITFKNSNGQNKAEKITVVKLTKEIPELNEFTKNNAHILKVEGKTITLAKPTVFGILMTPFEVSYSLDGETYITDNISTIGTNIIISGLSEGTKYFIRYSISKSNTYLELPKDLVYDFEVVTTLTPPDVKQNIDASKVDKIFVNVYNYTGGSYFAIVEDNDVFDGGFEFEIPENCIRLFEEVAEDGFVLDSYAIFDIAWAIALGQTEGDNYHFIANSEYTLYVLTRTEDRELTTKEQSPLTVFTSLEKIEMKKSDIQSTYNSITVNLEEPSDDSYYVIEYIVGGTGKTTITSILDDEVDLSPTFMKDGAVINISEDLALSDTLADTIYYLKIYKQKVCNANGEEITVKGEPIYFEIHTPESTWGQVAADFILKGSGYIGLGTMIALAILLAILITVFVMQKRKWRIQ